MEGQEQKGGGWSGGTFKNTKAVNLTHPLLRPGLCRPDKREKAVFSITDMNQNSLCGPTESQREPSSTSQPFPLWDIHFGTTSNLL